MPTPSSTSAREPFPRPAALHRAVPVGAREPSSLPRTAAPDGPLSNRAAVGPGPEPIQPPGKTEAELKPGTSADPACGDIVSVGWAASMGLKVEYRGRTYYFATKECRELFESHPEQYVADQGAPATVGSGSRGTAAASAAAADPVCGVEVDAAAARAAGRTSEHGGRTYVFCSELCKRRFDEDPAHYAANP